MLICFYIPVYTNINKYDKSKYMQMKLTEDWYEINKELALSLSPYKGTAMADCFSRINLSWASRQMCRMFSEFINHVKKHLKRTVHQPVDYLSIKQVMLFSYMTNLQNFVDKRQLLNYV